MGRTLEIAGERIRLGTSREVHLQFGESYLGMPVTIPVYVVRSRQSGPRLCLTGVLHGDELNGLGIVREFVMGRAPELRCGTLILVPVVNIYGLERHTRYMPDRRDPNRCFPGSASGSQTSRLVHAVYTQVIAQSDYIIDFHSASVRRTNYPNVRADVRDPRTRQIAEAFGCELIVNSKGPHGSLRRTAQEAGVPAIILEAGEVWKVQSGIVETGVRGCVNVMRALGMVGGEVEKPSFQVTVSRTVWVRAEQGGILAFHAKPGQLVRRGETLASVMTILGRDQVPVTSPVDGVVLGMTTMPAAKPGGPVYHMARLSQREFAQVERRLAAPGEDSYTQLQDELATSIDLKDP